MYWPALDGELVEFCFDSDVYSITTDDAQANDVVPPTYTSLSNVLLPIAKQTWAKEHGHKSHTYYLTVVFLHRTYIQK